MIPKFNMVNIVDDSGGKGCEYAVDGNVLDAARGHKEVRHSSPLQIRNAFKSESSLPFDVLPTPIPSTGASASLEDGVYSADLCRRAEMVRHVLGGNVLQIQDIHALQLKAIEVAELVFSVEEWYNSQLRERTSYMEHRIARLAETIVNSQSSTPTADKLLVPTTIRSRQSSSSTFSVVNRPTLSLSCEFSGRQTTCVAAAAVSHPPAMKWAKASTPESCRFHTQGKRPGLSLIRARNSSPLHQMTLLNQAAASRRTASCRLMHKEDLSDSWKAAGVDRRHTRSSRLSSSCRSRIGSDAENDELLENGFSRAKKRRNTYVANSSRTPIKNSTPRHHHLLYGRLQFTPEGPKQG